MKMVWVVCGGYRKRYAATAQRLRRLRLRNALRFSPLFRLTAQYAACFRRYFA